MAHTKLTAATMLLAVMFLSGCGSTPGADPISELSETFPPADPLTFDPADTDQDGSVSELEADAAATPETVPFETGMER